MKPTLYLETSIVGYHTGRPSRDLVIAGRQQITRDWWENERRKYLLHISALVLQESQRGDPEAIRRREQALKGIPLLGMMEQTRNWQKRLSEMALFRRNTRKMPFTSLWLQQIAWTTCSRGTSGISTMQE